MQTNSTRYLTQLCLKLVVLLFLTSPISILQVSDEELAYARGLVKEILGEDSFEPLPVAPSKTSQQSLPSRPNKRKVGHSNDTEEEDMYVDIKKLYAYDKVSLGMS